MTQTHTPGPWEIKYDHHGNGSFSEWYNVGPARVDIRRSEDNGAQSDANARLIAAAPQLLEALKDAHKALDSAEAVWIPGDPPEEIDHWVLDPIPYASATSHIRAAIKAATENGHA